MTSHSTSKRRMGVMVSVALTAMVVGIIVSCGDQQPPAAGASGGLGPPSCATPQTGCSGCTPGSVVACGERVDGDRNFIYCYEGQRSCGPNGVWGACVDGTVVTQSLASSLLHTSGYGTASACTGSDSAPLRVCTSGKKQGEFCSTALDCAGGVKKCLGGANDGASCKKEKDCADPGDCTSFNGTCVGGTRNGFGCDALLDCPGGTACNPAGGGGTCGLFSGLCDDNGPNDGEACNADADCGPGGQCKSDKHGHCQGGKENAKKCRHNKHCKGGASCSAEDPATPGVIDPCDPYCNVTADTASGLVVPGFQVIGGALVATGIVTCGDSIVSPPENCDDGNLVNNDGCTATCQISPGFQCPTPGMPCIPSTCGNGVKEGIEQCDDGNLRPYDGCAPDCTREVNCPAPAGATAQPCVAVCGDGIKFPTEACDDGNTTNGDGCSSTCTVEPGSTCVTITAPSPATLDVPVIYRDFQGGTAPPAHPDFQSPAPHAPYVSGACVGGAALCVGGQRRGIPTVTIGADKEPVYNTPQGCVGDVNTFNQWFHDTAAAKVILGKSIRLKNVAGSYVFDSAADTAYGLANINCGAGSTCAALGGFFPLNGLGWGNYAATGKNFHFTSEVRYPFTYAGGEVLSFSGDDDVFVYVGGKKVVDLGGIHSVENGSVTLNAATNTVPTSSVIGLVAGQTYEISVFQTERNTTGSNYKLTLQGFNRSISQCTPPAPPKTFVRDFEGVCPVGTHVEWQLFRWKAAIPLLSQIDFRAATADTIAALPPSPPAGAPTTVPIGSATPINSPVLGPIVFVNDTAPGPVPVPVSKHLQVEGLGQSSKQFLRVYMTFTGIATLFEWQQLFDCIPAE